jgi:hypothetical protein
MVQIIGKENTSLIAVAELLDEDSARCDTATLQSESDFILLNILFNFLGEPSSPFPAEKALDLPEDWFKQRSKEPEDIALLSISAEFAWFSNQSLEGSWRDLVDNWLAKCPQLSPLSNALETLRRRLVFQTELCQGVQRQVDSTLDAADSRQTSPLFAQCWRAFLECEWEQLDELIKELSSITRRRGEEMPITQPPAKPEPAAVTEVAPPARQEEPAPATIHPFQEAEPDASARTQPDYRQHVTHARRNDRQLNLF